MEKEKRCERIGAREEKERGRKSKERDGRGGPGVNKR